MQQAILILIAIIAGAVLPFQAGLNIQLGKAINQPIFASFASFIAGGIGLFIYLLFLKFDFSSIAQVKGTNVWMWLAGLLGAFYVSSVIMLAPKLGIALTFSLMVAGQMLAALVVDHFGLMGLPVSTINWQRMVGVAFLISGVLMIRKF